MKILIPCFVSQAHYQEFRDNADDRDGLCEDLKEYEEAALMVVENCKKAGGQVIRSEINLVDLIKWLKNHKYQNIGKHRSVYYAKIAQDCSIP